VRASCCSSDAAQRRNAAAVSGIAPLASAGSSASRSCGLTGAVVKNVLIASPAASASASASWKLIGEPAMSCALASSCCCMRICTGVMGRPAIAGPVLVHREGYLQDVAQESLHLSPPTSAPRPRPIGPAASTTSTASPPRC
jgi:hypothetical protein